MITQSLLSEGALWAIALLFSFCFITLLLCVINLVNTFIKWEFQTKFEKILDNLIGISWTGIALTATLLFVRLLMDNI